MNRESDNMVLVTYNLDPEYSVKEIDSRQQLIADTTAHPPAFSVQLQKDSHNVYNQNNILYGLSKILFWLFSKNMLEKSCGSRILFIDSYFRICVISDCYESEKSV